MVVDPMVALARGGMSEDRAAETEQVDATADILAFRSDIATDGLGRARRRAAREPGATLVGPRLDQLVRTIKTDIVPRLLMAQPGAPAAASLPPLGEAEIAAFTAIVLTGGIDEIMASVEAFQAQGLGLDRIYLDLFAPTARRLGVMWEEDDCDFATVTLALHHLHGLLHACRPAFADEPLRPDPGRLALLCALPGEQHLFGLAIVGEFFRHAGWEVTDAVPASRQAMAQLVQSQAYAVVGLTLSRDSLLETLTGCIRTIRRSSRNPAIGVLVGGPIFNARPELVALVGADAAASDGRSAVLQAERLRSLLWAGAPARQP